MVSSSQEASARQPFDAVGPSLLLWPTNWGAKIYFGAHREGARIRATCGPEHASAVADSASAEPGRSPSSITGDQGLHERRGAITSFTPQNLDKQPQQLLAVHQQIRGLK